MKVTMTFEAKGKKEIATLRRIRKMLQDPKTELGKMVLSGVIKAPIKMRMLAKK